MGLTHAGYSGLNLQGSRWISCPMDYVLYREYVTDRAYEWYNSVVSEE